MAFAREFFCFHSLDLTKPMLLVKEGWQFVVFWRSTAFLKFMLYHQGGVTTTLSPLSRPFYSYSLFSLFLTSAD